jgi:hypothetical protein
VARLAWIHLPARLVAVTLALVAAACAGRRVVRSDLGIPPCVPGAGARLLEPPALECWFTAAHGRWRLMTQASHLEALVVDVAVDDLRDAGEVARLFVAGERHRYSEIIVYAHRQPVTPASRVRRVRWTTIAGYEALEFGSSLPTDSGSRESRRIFRSVASR